MYYLAYWSALLCFVSKFTITITSFKTFSSDSFAFFIYAETVETLLLTVAWLTTLAFRSSINAVIFVWRFVTYALSGLVITIILSSCYAFAFSYEKYLNFLEMDRCVTLKFYFGPFIFCTRIQVLVYLPEHIFVWPSS